MPTTLVSQTCSQIRLVERNRPVFLKAQKKAIVFTMEASGGDNDEHKLKNKQEWAIYFISGHRSPCLRF